MASSPKLKKRAAEFEQKKQFDKALELYVQILEGAGRDLADDDVPLYNRVGDLLMRQSRVSEALSYYEHAVDVYAERGYLNNAIALCNKILRQSPGRTAVYYKLGKISANKGFKSDARKNFLEYAERMQKAGNLDEAFRALKEFAALYPDQDDIRLILAEQLSRENRKGEALEQLQELYVKLEREGRDAEARATIDRMKAINPEATPRMTASQGVEKPNDLVFLDLSESDSRPRLSPEPSPAIPAARAPAPAEPQAQIPALEGLDVTFVPASDADRAQKPAVAQLDGFEATSAEAEDAPPRTVREERGTGEHLETAAASGRDAATPPDGEESEIVLLDLSPESDAGVELDIEPVPGLEVTDATEAAGPDRPNVSGSSPLVSQHPLSGTEFAELSLNDQRRRASERSHDLALPSELPMLDVAASADRLNEAGDGGVAVTESRAATHIEAPQEDSSETSERERTEEFGAAWADSAAARDVATDEGDSTAAEVLDAADVATDRSGDAGEAMSTTVASVQEEPAIDNAVAGEDQAAAEPGATEPGATEPGATEPGATEPGATEHDAVAREANVAEADDVREEADVVSGSGSHGIVDVDVAPSDSHVDDVVPDSEVVNSGFSGEVAHVDDGVAEGNDSEIPEAGALASAAVASADADTPVSEDSGIGAGELDADSTEALASCDVIAEDGLRAEALPDEGDRVTLAEAGAAESRDEGADQEGLAQGELATNVEAAPAHQAPADEARVEHAPVDERRFVAGDAPAGTGEQHPGSGEGAHAERDDDARARADDAGEQSGPAALVASEDSGAAAEPVGVDATAGSDSAGPAGKSAADSEPIAEESSGPDAVPDDVVAARAEAALDTEWPNQEPLIEALRRGPLGRSGDFKALDEDGDALAAEFGALLDGQGDDIEDLLSAPPTFGEGSAYAERPEFSPIPGFAEHDDASSGAGARDAASRDERDAEAASAESSRDDESRAAGPRHGKTGGRDPRDDRSAARIEVRTPRPTVSLGGAEGHLRQRLELDPENWSLRRQLGEALLDSGARDDGLYELELAMVGFELASQLDRAQEVADEIIRVLPTSVRHHQKRVEYAVRAKDRPRLIEAYLELADALFRTGEAEKSVTVYARVLELDPGSDRAVFALATLAPDILARMRGLPVRSERWSDELDAIADSGPLVHPDEDSTRRQTTGDMEAVRAAESAARDRHASMELAEGSATLARVSREVEAMRRETPLFLPATPSPEPDRDVARATDPNASVVLSGSDFASRSDLASASDLASGSDLASDDDPTTTEASTRRSGTQPSLDPTGDVPPAGADARVVEPSTGGSDTGESEAAAAAQRDPDQAAETPEPRWTPAGLPPITSEPAEESRRPRRDTPILNRARSLTPAPGSADPGFVDLGEWLRDTEPVRSTRMVIEETKPSGDEQADFEDMLRRFKRGVAENVDEEDFDAHYDLGVAYKEMGLVDEAIAEFQKALRGREQRVRAYEALGQCFVEKAQFPIAAALLQRAAEMPGIDDQQLVGVLYLLGFASEQTGRHGDALRYYQRVFAVDIQFRDITTRVSAMEQLAK